MRHAKQEKQFFLQSIRPQEIRSRPETASTLQSCSRDVDHHNIHMSHRIILLRFDLPPRHPCFAACHVNCLAADNLTVVSHKWRTSGSAMVLASAWPEPSLRSRNLSGGEGARCFEDLDRHSGKTRLKTLMESHKARKALRRWRSAGYRSARWRWCCGVHARTRSDFCTPPLSMITTMHSPAFPSPHR